MRYDFELILPLLSSLLAPLKSDTEMTVPAAEIWL
jgi:hypothetical protein